MQEKRLVERLKRYWETIKSGDEIPDFQRFSPDAVSDLWPRCLTLEVVHNDGGKGALYTYAAMGKEIMTAYGCDLTGQHVNVNMHNFPGWQVLHAVDELLRNPDVYDSEGSFVSNVHKIVRYRAVLLPFGRDGRVTHIVVGLSWRALG